jgi:hypothetical protein
MVPRETQGGGVSAIEEASLVDYIDRGRVVWRPGELLFCELLDLTDRWTDAKRRLDLGRADKLTALREQIDRILRGEQCGLFDP